MPKILLSASQESPSNYENALRGVGAEPVTHYCPTPDLAWSCDGLLLSGGVDVHPALYGRENAGTEAIDLDRDRAELTVLRAFLAAGKPVLGICRGHQLINVFLGGTLIQDLGPKNDTHRDTPDGDRIHLATAVPGTLFEQLYGPHFSVNSAHHQAVETLAPGLTPLLHAGDGTVEAMCHKSLPILSVQFHPERMAFAKRRPDAVDGEAVFRAFLKFFA